MITRTNMIAYSNAIEEYFENQSSDRKGYGNVYVGNAGQDVVVNYANGSQIYTGAGNDNVTSIAGGVVIDTADGDDTVIALGNKTDIKTGSGNDQVYAEGHNINVDTGTGSGDTTYVSGYGAGGGTNITVTDVDSKNVFTPSFLFQYIKNQGLIFDPAYVEETQEPEEDDYDTVINIYQ